LKGLDLSWRTFPKDRSAARGAEDVSARRHPKIRRTPRAKGMDTNGRAPYANASNCAPSAPAPRLAGGPTISATTEQAGGERDSADLAKVGYTEQLRRSLGTFSSFAVAFSYISPSTGIFALFFLGLTTIGGVFFWSWPIVAAGQFI